MIRQMVIERPIKMTPLLMKGDLVMKTLKGQKIMTCRPIEDQPVPYKWDPKKRATAWHWKTNNYRQREVLEDSLRQACPWGQPGDFLWVRETLRCDRDGFWYYAANHYPIPSPEGMRQATIVWADHWRKKGVCPSIHMPRWACRIEPQILTVRPMPITELDAQDFIDEGFSSRLDEQAACDELRDQFRETWDALYPKTPFVSTTWVYAISYTINGQRQSRTQPR